MSAAENKAVFLSYASQDAEAAKRIADALRAAGVEVWFDQNELVGGDAWDAKIRKQIAECALFLPVISANTQARLEGYFRVEWKLAARRTHAMATAKAFLLPVVIDDTRDAEAHVPDEFRDVQWTRLAGGETSAAFCGRVKKLLGGEGVAAVSAVGASLDDARGRGRVTPLRSAARPWLVPAVIALTVVVGIAVWQPWKKSGSPAIGKSSDAAQFTAPLSEAQRLADQARALLLKPGGGPSKYETAALLCDRALTLDPTDADVWAIASQADTKMAFHSFDRSEKRIESARSKGAKAIHLAPGSFEARLAQGMFQALIGGQPSAAEAESSLRALRRENPREFRVLDSLGVLLRDGGRGEEAVACFAEAALLPGGAVSGLTQKAWALRGLWRFDEADAALDQSIALQPIAGNIGLKVFLELCWRGDLERALATMRILPAEELTMDVGVAAAVRLYRWRREPAEVLKFLAAVPRDWLTWGIAGPKAALTGDANAELKKPAAARADWQIALKLVEQRLTATPNDRTLLEWKAYLEASLGETAQAQATWQRSREAPAQSMPALLSVEKIHRVAAPDQVIDELERRVRDAIENLAQGRQATIEFFSAADLRLNPAWDGLRNLPRFQALQARLDADARFSPTAKKQSAAADAPAATADPQSIAVLAFENRADPVDERFADGLSEEISRVLSRQDGFKVTGRTSAFFFKGKQVPAREIGQQLGVAHLVTGNVRRSGTQLRVSAELSRAADGLSLWSDSYVREAADVFSLEDEIAQTIAQKISPKLNFAAAAARTARDPRVVERMAETYAAVSVNPVAVEQGIRDVLAFEKAGASEWSWASSIYTLLGNTGVAGSYEQARQAALKAIALQPELSNGYASLARAQFLGEWNIRAARQSAAKAVERARTNDELIFAGATARMVGRRDDAVRLAREVLERDPLNGSAHWETGTLLFEIDDVAADAAIRRAITLDPELERRNRPSLVALKLRQGRLDEAAALAEQIRGEGPRLFFIARIRQAQGRPAEAEAALRELKARFSQSYAYQIAMLQADRGEVDAAFEWLETAYRQRDGGLVNVALQKSFEPLRADPRWPVFLRKTGLAEETK